LKSTSDVVDAVKKHITAGRFERAVQMCDKVLTTSPYNVSVLALLAVAREHAGDIRGARKAALRWVSTAPLDCHAHYRLAAIEQRLQNYPAARERFELAADLAAPGGDVARAAGESLLALDSLQLQQVAALREVDMAFRVGLRLAPHQALVERGFDLDDDVVRRLARVEAHSAHKFSARPPRPC